jgi:hypothetical protein
MRYRIGEVPVEGAYGGSGDFVSFTVWITFAIGIGFLVVGLRAGQRWLAVWGGLTIIACGIYAFAIWRGLLS